MKKLKEYGINIFIVSLISIYILYSIGFFGVYANPQRTIYIINKLEKKDITRECEIFYINISSYNKKYFNKSITSLIVNSSINGQREREIEEKNLKKLAGYCIKSLRNIDNIDYENIKYESRFSDTFEF